MSDIVEKLHEYARCAETRYEIEMCDEAIKEIEQLREALKPFADMAHEFDDLFNGEEFWEDSDVLDCHQFDAVPTVGNFRAARAAIREGGKDA